MDRLNQIKQYFDGKLSQQEAHEFLKWFTSTEHEGEVQAEIDKLWQLQGKPEHNWDGSKVFNLVQQKKDNGRELGLLRSRPETQRSYQVGWMKIAAAVALLVAVSLVFVGEDTQTDQNSEVVHEQITKANPPGQKSRVYLPDGSIVNLNSNSQLTFTEGFSDGRQVYLEGEAFFDVKKDSLRPFTVYSGRLATTALGTSFNINAYGSEEEEVVLVSGKVNVKDSGSKSELLLTPGEKVSVKLNDGSFRKTKADLLAHTYWKEGILYFEKTSMRSVITTLERWYGVRIKIEGEIPEDKCTGIFQKNEYLTNVLDILSHSVAFDYRLDNKEVKLIFN